MPSIKTKIGAGGRVVIPAEYRKRLGVKPGDDVVLVMDDSQEIRLFTLQKAIGRIQDLMKRHIHEGISLTDELLEERRREAL